jgi:hypothetical protein
MPLALTKKTRGAAPSLTKKTVELPACMLQMTKSWGQVRQDLATILWAHIVNFN